MTDIGSEVDLPNFLQGSEPIAQVPVVLPDRMQAVREAIRKRGLKTREVHHENHHTKTLETLETIPPDLLDAIRDLMASLPEYQRRLDALEEHAKAGSELHAALAGLQQINGIFGQMNDKTTGRIDEIENSLAVMQTMMEPLGAFLSSLDSKRAA